MPAPLSEDIRKGVRAFWATERDKPNSDGTPPSRQELWTRYGQKKGKDLSRSSFYEIIREAEREVKQPFPREEWNPWADPQETAEDTDFLLRLNAIKQAEEGGNLLKAEAEWGRRLRTSLAGLNSFGQYRLMEMYYLREVKAYYLHTDRYTADLDGILAYKPWLPDNLFAYDLAVASGIAPYPFKNPHDPPVPSFAEFLGADHENEWPASMWKNTPAAREEFSRYYNKLFGPGSFVNRMLEPRESQFIWKGDKSEIRQGLSRVDYGEDDEVKGPMLNLILKFWAGAETASGNSVDFV